MAWFDAEKMVKNLIAGLGVNPEDFVAFIAMARTEFLEMRADRLAFKPASAKAYQDIMARMDRLEAGVHNLTLLALQIHAAHFPPKEPSDEQHHVNGH